MVNLKGLWINSHCCWWSYHILVYVVMWWWSLPLHDLFCALSPSVSYSFLFLCTVRWSIKYREDHDAYWVSGTLSICCNSGIVLFIHAGWVFIKPNKCQTLLYSLGTRLYFLIFVFWKTRRYQWVSDDWLLSLIIILNAPLEFCIPILYTVFPSIDKM